MVQYINPHTISVSRGEKELQNSVFSNRFLLLFMRMNFHEIAVDSAATASGSRGNRWPADQWTYQSEPELGRWQTSSLVVRQR